MKVLIVDDEPLLVGALSRALQNDGHQVHSLTDPTKITDFLDAPGAPQLDLVLLDYVMMGMNGLDVLQIIRRRYDDVPVVLMSGCGDRDVLAQAINHGCDGFVEKPFMIEDIRRVLARAQRRIANIRDAGAQALLEETEMTQRSLAGAFHELKQPITALVGLAQLGALDARDRADEDYLREMMDNSQRAIGLIDSIMGSLARGETQPIRLETPVADLVMSACQAARARLGGKELRVEWELTPTDLRWSMDRALVARALDDLLSNAVKFTPSGGAIRLSVRVADGRCLFEVFDTGIGVPAGEADRLFGRASRLSNAANVAGRGYGLWAAKQIVQAHGGEIAWRPNRPYGSVFGFRLPTPEVSRSAAPAKRAVISAKRRNARRGAHHVATK